MRMNPPFYRSTGSDAEKKLFKVIENVDFGDDSICFHSMNISEHEYKNWAEIDFIIISSRGIICLEVKGGRVAYEDGIWTFTDRYGKTHSKSEGPFTQVSTATYALDEYLKKNNNINIFKKYVVGWGVVFPDIKWSTISPEMPKEIVCDKYLARETSSFEKYLKKVYGYHEEKNRTRKKRMSSDEIRNLKNILRPNFDHGQSLSDISDEFYKKIVKFTDEQYIYLDQIEDNARIICSGGAGTGKSFLAIQTALREAKKNKNVLVTSLHEIFVKYLENQFHEKDLLNITVLPLNEIRTNSYAQKFDLVVVDEAQDIMNVDDIDCLDGLIKGGLEKGRWRFFLDENAQAGIIGKFDKCVFQIIKDYSSTIQKLSQNCRNTSQIVLETEDTTEAYIGKTRIEDNGPKVQYKKIKNDSEEVVEIGKYLEKLVTSEVPLNEIAILSPVRYEKSIIRNIEPYWKKAIENINADNICSKYQRHILFSSIKDFKGLERKHILIIDTDLLPEDNNLFKSFLYVGMTRAQINLWIAMRINFAKIKDDLQLARYKNENKK
jgi:hypothetical protein